MHQRNDTSLINREEYTVVWYR